MIARARSSALLVAGLLLAGTAVAACSTATADSGGKQPSSSVTAPASPSTDNVSLANVTLHVGDQAGAGSQALLTAAGLIGKLPFKVAWSDFTSGPPMLQAMSGGSVDIGSVGDAPPIFAAAGGSQI